MDGLMSSFMHVLPHHYVTRRRCPVSVSLAPSVGSNPSSVADERCSSRIVSTNGIESDTKNQIKGAGSTQDY
jgi:hypothetical protein